jgi:hypothetical protein
MSDTSNLKLGVAPELELIISFKDLLESFNDPNRHIVDVNKAFRLELYKLTYLSEKFNLYQKSDAGEALQQILIFLHTTALDIPKRIKKIIQLPSGKCHEYEALVEDINCDQSKCFVHSTCGLSIRYDEECSSCRQTQSSGTFDKNHFLHVFNASEYLARMSNLNYNDRVMPKIFVSMQTQSMSDVKTCQNGQCRYFKK